MDTQAGSVKTLSTKTCLVAAAAAAAAAAADEVVVVELRVTFVM